MDPMTKLNIAVRRLVGFSLVVVLSVALGDLSGSDHAFAQTEVVVRTDFKFNGYVSPLALAIDKGFYKANGLDVSIEQGQGSATTVQTVASGVDTFGLADSATAVLGISAQNVPIKIVSVYNQTGTMGLIYRADSGWNGDLHALKNKVVISSAGSADAKLLEPTLATAQMTTDDLQFQLVDFNARVPLFLQTPNSFLTGFQTGDYLRVRARMPDAKYVPYAKYGLVVYGIGLIVRDETISASPDLVKKFAAVTRQGWELAAKDPESAIAASLKLYPDLSPDLLRQGLKISLEEQLHTPATAGHPIGWTDEGDWIKMLEVLKKYSGITAKPSSAYYTNRFVE
jgi:NitT/TauT family transport system substrate-binding protein